jgi:hypothetical protein
VLGKRAERMSHKLGSARLRIPILEYGLTKAERRIAELRGDAPT